jgi:hypothetical protein
MTLDAICKISFGVEMGSLAPSLPTIPFAKAFETTNEIVTARFVDPLWKLKRFLNVSSEATVVQSAKEIDDFVYNVICTRRIELKELQQSQNGDHLAHSKVAHSKVHYLCDIEIFTFLSTSSIHLSRLIFL